MQKNNTFESGERRAAMDNLFDSGISIEKFAAYLDGNLSDQEMNEVSSFIDSNEKMQNFSLVNNQIEGAISSYSVQDMELPSALQSTDFDFPCIEGAVIDSDPFDNSHEEVGLSDSCCDVNFEDFQFDNGETDDIDYYDGEMPTNHSDDVTDDINSSDDVSFMDFNE